MNQLLKEHRPGTDRSTLDINYPYLQNSFDEDQVGSFIERKHAVKEKIDCCVQGSFDKEVHLTGPGWQEFLRQPVPASALEDPYPARFEPSDVPLKNYPGPL